MNAPIVDLRFDSFILYSSREVDRVAPVCSGLVERGLRPYFDIHDLPPGSDWNEFEQGILSEKPVVILFLGPAGWGPNHRRLAIELDYRRFAIIPVLLGPPDDEALRDVGQIFHRLKYIRIDDLDPHLLDQLAAAVRNLQTRDRAQPVPEPPPEPSPGSGRRVVDLRIDTRALSDTSRMDLLGFADYADALADLIRNAQTEKPLTIGVEAPWGMGKTRLMRMIRERLTNSVEGGTSAIPTVWFDAWKYDKEESLWAALALEVMSQTRKELSTWRWLAVWMDLNWRRIDRTMVARTVLNAAVYALLFGMLLLAAYPFLVTSLGAYLAWQYVEKAGIWGAVAALLKALYSVHKQLAVPFDEKIAKYVKQPKYEERVGFIARFQSDFKEIVKAVTGGGAQPLVIFIDDLDRCTPVKAVEVLEAINLLLDSERCVFVIGMDSKAVAASIEAKYKDVAALMKGSDDPGGLTLGQRFLEKILQIEFRLPPPLPDHMARYVDAVLGYIQPAPSVSAAVKAQALEAKERMAREEEKGKSLDEAAQSEALADVPEQVVVEAKVERFAESFDNYTVVRNAVNSAAVFLGNNPRKVKRFINAFRLQALIANRRKLLEENVIDLELLAKWLLAETRWPELMNDVLDEPGLLERAAAVRRVRDDYSREPSPDTQRKLQALSEDPRVKRLTEAEDATAFIADLRTQAGEQLEAYLHLGRIVGQAKMTTAASA